MLNLQAQCEKGTSREYAMPKNGTARIRVIASDDASATKGFTHQPQPIDKVAFLVEVACYTSVFFPQRGPKLQTDGSDFTIAFRLALLG